MVSLDLSEPILLLDEEKCRRNIARMAEKAARSGARFRPHFKTHQSLEVGEWFRDVGVTGITVSSVAMAEFFSSAWDDITIAIPFNVREIERVNALPKDCAINLCVMYPETVRALEAELNRAVRVWIDTDVGYHRTGLEPDDPMIHTIVAEIERCQKLSFSGFLTHAGHSYDAAGPDAVRAVDSASQGMMKSLKERFLGRFANIGISLGDTPACSIVESFEGVDELRPGNLVFYDLMQHSLGACELNDIAVAMACPVIAKYKGRLVVHGGGAHFSRDLFEDNEGPCHGWILEASERRWGDRVPGLRLVKLSQEHGTVTGPQESLDRYEVGDMIYIAPAHSCLTVCAMRSYTTLDGCRIITL